MIYSNTHLKSRETVPLKGQCHEIFDLRFFHQTILLDPLSGSLEGFRFYFRIRRDIRIRKLIRVVGYNAEKNSFNDPKNFGIFILLDVK